MGSQHRSEPYQLAVRDIVRSGRIGEIVHIEQEWNINMERWRFVNMDTGTSREMVQDRNMEWRNGSSKLSRNCAKRIPIGSGGYWVNLIAPLIPMYISSSVFIRISLPESSISG